MINNITGPLSTLVNEYQGVKPELVVPGASPINEEKPKVVENAGETTKKSPGRRSSPAECETCKNRKYQDGSDEMVSFKSAAHISPNAAASRVRAHEQEHVSNAFNKATMNNGKVLSAVVSIHTAVCPECGRTYVSGGTTQTKIKYFGDDNGYHKAQDAANDANFNGTNINTTV